MHSDHTFRTRWDAVLPILSFCLFTTVGIAADAKPHPNVVVILADDQGWGDLSVHGNSNIQTPNIDTLARDGAMFDRFYVCPVCSPTRAEFLTGRYHPRGGVWGVSTGGERLDLDERTVAQAFHDAGYATAIFGKWHNGMQYPYHPNARGFDEQYGFCSGHWGHYFSPELEHNGKLVRGEGYITDDLTNHAMAFIEEHKDSPFFCYVPFNTPHSPMQVPDEYANRFAKKDLSMFHRDPTQEDTDFTRAALAMCENIDWNVGRLLAQLDKLNLADNTIVIYFSDNGPNSYRWNDGMKGRKGATDEGGVRVPMLIRWPGHIPAGERIEPIAGAIDIYPTLAQLCNVPITGEKPLDGKSLVPLLEGDSKDWPKRMIFSHWAGKVSVRTDDYRLDHLNKLYDMKNDPGQAEDVRKQHPDVAKRLSKAKEEWIAEMLPGLRKDNRPFPVGYREAPETHLPARDGVAHGGIERSNRAPNCSYFTHWTSTKDSITWDIEVETTGDYEAQVYYTCPEKDLGSTIELTFGKANMQAKVTKANDPPLVGELEDRVPRGSESYVKDFKPMTLGTFHLEKGRGPLTLRALKVAGKEVMDVRYVILTLVP